MPVHAQDLDAVVTAVRTQLARGWAPWPGGYPDDVELALVDAVFSIRAQYGSKGSNGARSTGVRAVVERWREHRGGHANDLRQIADCEPEALVRTLDNGSKTSGRTKASAVQEAASKLVAAGVTTAADVRDHTQAARRAYVGVHGLNWVTFTYFGMLLGVPGVKADTWINRFVSRALDRDVSAEEANGLVQRAAGRFHTEGNTQMPQDASTLDHALWSSMRRTSAPAAPGRVAKA